MSTVARRQTGLPLGDLFFAVGVGAVPVLLHGPLRLLLCCVAAAAVATRSWSRAAILAAYVAPALFGAWWPVHCLSAAGMWLLLTHRSGADVRRARTATSVDRTPLLVLGLALLGGIAGALVVFLDRVRLLGGGFVFDVVPPSTSTLVAAVVALALVNALGEELLWREVLDRTLAVESAGVRYAVQVVTFGVGHWSGIPSGAVGVLASGVFSAVVYRVRERTGLFGAIVVHTVADLVIFAVVARYAVFAWTGFTWTAAR